MDNSSLEPKRTLGPEITPLARQEIGAVRPIPQVEYDPGASDGSEMSMSSMMRVLRRRWVVPVGLAIVLGFATYAVSIRQPKQYEATAEVLVQSSTGAQAGGNDQLNILESVLSGASGDIATQVENLTSDDVLNEVSQRLNLGLAPNDMRLLFKVTPHKVAQTIILIDVHAKSPKLAVDLINTLLDVYNEKLNGADFSVTRRSVRVIAGQLGTVKNQLDLADDAYTSYKKQVGSVDIATDTTSTATQQAILKTDLLQAQRDAKIADANRQFYANQYATQPNEIIQGLSFSENPRILSDKATISQLENQRAALALQYTPRDQQMQAIDAKINSAKADIVNEREAENHVVNPGLGVGTKMPPVSPPAGDWGLNGGSLSLNPTREQARAEIVTSMASAEAARAQSDAINQSMATVNQSVEALPSVQQKMLSLEDDAEIERKVYDTLREQLASLQAQSKVQQSYIVPLQSPVLNPNAVFPLPGIYASLAVVIGLILGIVAIFMVDSSDDRIYEVSDVAKSVPYPVLSDIGRDSVRRLSGGDQALVRTDSLQSYETLASTLVYMGVGRSIGTLMVTSPNVGDGVSYTASQLALVFSKAGMNVILVDANVRNPSLHTLFGTQNNEGLAGLMRNGMNTEAALVPVEKLQALRLIPGGLSEEGAFVMPNFFEPGKLALLMKSLKDEAAIVIVDAPPVSTSMETAALADKVDGILLVLRSGITQADDAKQAAQLLSHAGARVVGCVINNPLPKRRN